jgi:hypothetical protein
MQIKDPDHAVRALIEAAKTNLKHAANVARGKTAFWYLLGGGVGGGALLAGAGILCGGYSYIVGNPVIAQQTADGVAAALAHTTIKTDGTVTLANGAQVTLADGGRVSLDPNSPLLRVSGQTEETAREDTLPTWLTAYKLVDFASGWVESTASFWTSSAQKPFRERCGYVENVSDGLWRSVALEKNGQRLAAPNPSPFPAVDLNAAASLCVQLTNPAAQAVAPVAPAAPVKTILVHAAKRQGAT